MPLILNIDTATELASVCLSNADKILAQKENALQKEHASFIHEAIKDVMAQAGEQLKNIDAIAITGGPGSYTGLRVGMSTAKGLCYVLNKPLITISTLKVMAHAAIVSNKFDVNGNFIFCPMIDARRLEVFTALYNSSNEEILPPCAMILEPTSFDNWLEKNKIIFTGSGSEKFEKMPGNPNAVFKKVVHNAAHLASLAYEAYLKNEFADLAYAEPLYIKAFHSTQK